MPPGDPRYRLTGSRRLRAGGALRAWLTTLAAITVGGVLLAFGLVIATVVLVLALVAGAVGYGVLRWKLRRWRAQLGAAARPSPAGRREVIDVQARWRDGDGQ